MFRVFGENTARLRELLLDVVAALPRRAAVPVRLGARRHGPELALP